MAGKVTVVVTVVVVVVCVVVESVSVETVVPTDVNVVGLVRVVVVDFVLVDKEVIVDVAIACYIESVLGLSMQTRAQSQVPANCVGVLDLTYPDSNWSLNAGAYGRQCGARSADVLGK